MTATEVDRLSFIDATQVWPVGTFPVEPPQEVEIGPEDEPSRLLNWHVYNLSLDRTQNPYWQQLKRVGDSLGGRFGYGHLEADHEQQKIDELNLITESLDLYMAFHRLDPGARPNREFAIAKIGEFILRDVHKDVGVELRRTQIAEPVVVGRDGRRARLNNVRNGWLFVPEATIKVK